MGLSKKHDSSREGHSGASKPTQKELTSMKQNEAKNDGKEMQETASKEAADSKLGIGDSDGDVVIEKPKSVKKTIQNLRKPANGSRKEENDESENGKSNKMLNKV